VSDDILVAVKDGVATVTMNRPQKRNAVHLQMWRRLETTFLDLARDASLRVAILTGAGGNFCAGADISEFAEVRADAKSGHIYEEATEAATIAIRDFPLPTIAAVSGFGVGGGCGLALACDFRVGDPGTRMGIPAARLGIIYSELDCSLLYRAVGLARAKHVLFSGRHFAVDQCLGMGLIDSAHETDALEGAHELAGEFVANAPLSLCGSKFVLEALATHRTEEKRESILALMDRALESEDYKEGARAFMEKRKPAFVGR
jgi:enoyl-CoA hydratase/carnithine racemase